MQAADAAAARPLSGSGLPHTHSTLGRGGVKAQCLPAAIPHGIGFLSRHAGQSPQPAFPHIMLPLRSFATRRRLAMTGFCLHANLLMPGFD